LKERVVPFIKYRFFAYALSLGLIVIFSTMTIARGGIRMGVDFVGGQKIIARFEKGVNEEHIRKALTAFSPTVQQIGDTEHNEYIIQTKISGESLTDIQERIAALAGRTFPGMEILGSRAVLMSSKDAIPEAAANALIAPTNAVFGKIGDPAKNIFAIYPRETADKKKSYNPDTAVNILRGTYENLDILKGMALVAVFNKPADEKKLADSLGALHASQVNLGYVAKPAYLIYKVAVDESDRIRAELDKNFKNAQVMSVENIGPAVGEFLKKSALKLIIVSILLMTIYLAYRFEFRYSVGAMVAVLHDVFLAVAFCGAFGVEINIPVIAALLTIFGYSVNDTIVIFDRIRESTQIESKSTFVEIVNKSVTFTMSRTILTSYLTLLTVFALFFLGGEGISDFAMVLLFGMIVGVYSTVYIASPVVISWEKLMARIRS
jgi:preprotein translocase subunit SecF